jgi:hypothetical protein
LTWFSIKKYEKVKKKKKNREQRTTVFVPVLANQPHSRVVTVSESRIGGHGGAAAVQGRRTQKAINAQ